LTFEDPIKLVLSDRFISIPATIASGAVNAFEKKCRKRITERTQGGVIQLLQFEIVVTHLGEPSEKLTLLVQEFKHIGSDGSGTFGHPQPITEKISLQNLLTELKAFRDQEAAKQRANQDGFETRSARSEESSNGFYDEHDDGQRDFATQKPKRKTCHHIQKPMSTRNEASERPALKRPRPGDDGEQDYLLHSRSPIPDHTASPIARRQLRDGVAEITKSSITSRLPRTDWPISETGSRNTHDELLALLTNRSGRRRAEHDKSTSVANRMEEHHDGHPVSVVAAQEQSDMAEIDNIISEAAIAAQLTLRSTSESPENADENKATLNALEKVQCEPGVLDVGRTSVAQKINGSSPHMGHDQVLDGSTIGLLANKVLFKVEEVEDPWQGMTLIRKKDKSIPVNQDKLLSRKDCWLPPERGERAPVSNVPLEILQSLTESVERSAASRDVDIISPNKGQKSTPRSKANEFLPKSNSSHASDEEDREETPFTSSNWPPSSPPVVQRINELPPDSSVEVPSPVHLDQPRGGQEYQTTACSKDIELQKSKSRTSSPGPEVSSINHSPRSFAGSLNNEEAGSCFPATKQNILEPIHPHAEEHRLSRDPRNSKPITSEVDDMELADLRTVSKETAKAVIDLDSDSTDSSQSDLEMAVPNALQDHDMFSYGNERQQTPSRSSNDRSFTLQVHRTPYTAQQQRTKGNLYPLGKDISPLNQQMDEWDIEERRRNATVDVEVSIQAMIPGTFSQSDHANHVNAHRSKTTIEQAPDVLMTTPTLDRLSHSTREIIEPKPPTAKKLSTVNEKRQAEETDETSSNITKRRKHTKFALPDVHEDVDDEKPREDPSTRARQLRREFMKNLRAISTASGAPPSPLLSDVDLREPSIPKAKRNMQPNLDEHEEHGANQAWLKVRPTGPQTPEEPIISLKSSPTKRRIITSPQFQDQNAEDIPTVSSVAPAPITPAQDTILDRFQEAYPEYGGNEKQFVALCRKVDALVKENRMLHKSLWDDFVIRHQREYRVHLARCADEAEDPMPYETFYSAEIEEPIFTKRILSPANLAAAISLGLPAQKQSLMPAKAVVETTIDLTQNTPEPQVFEVHRRQSSGKSAVAASRKELSGGLDQSNEVSTSAQGQPLSSTASKTPRRLPWSTAHTGSPTPASSRHQNVKTSKASLASTPASAPKDAFVAPRIMTQPAASNIAGPSRRTAHPSTPPVVHPSTAKSAPSHKGKAAVDMRDHKPSIPPATAGPTASSTEATSSNQPKSGTGLLRNSRKQETNPTRTTLPSATPGKPWYLDPVNPFKQFARADASIRSGADNGFVEEKDKQGKKERPVVVNKDGVVLAELKKVDVLGWRL